MRHILHIILVFLLFFLYGRPSLSQIPEENLQAWYKADQGVFSENGKVYQWNDMSENLFHLIQLNSSNQPSIINNFLGENPIIRFGSGHSLEAIFNQSFSQPGTFFVVWRTENAQGPAFSINSLSADGLRAENNNRIFARAGNNFVLNRPTPFGFILHTWELSGATSKIFENGVFKATGNSGDNPVTKLLLGKLTAFPAYQLIGDIAEIIFYDTILAVEQRQQVETYLLNKYAPPVNLGGDLIIDYGFCPVILDAGEGFSTYQWSTGEETQTIEVSFSGNYGVSVENVFGISSSDEIIVTFPNANISLESEVLCSGTQLVLTTFLNDKEYYDYLWSNGETQPTITITEPGYYWVMFTDSLGCVAYSDTVSIVLDSFPQDYTLGGDLNLCAGNVLEANVDNPNGFSFLWSTGVTEPNITITESGYYSITVTNPNGCVATDEIFVNIIGTAPLVDFSATTECLNNPTQFSDLSMPEPGDELSSWLWDFGDENFSSEQNPLFVFPGAGTFNVSLLVEAASGCSQAISKEIEVLPIPDAFFESGETCINITFQFVDLSAPPEGGMLSSWEWYFSNGYESFVQNPVVSFSEPGLFEVNLSVFAANGCSDTYSAVFNVVDSAPAPVPFDIFVPKNDQVFPSENISISWNVSENATDYQLEVATDPDFNNIVFTSEVTKNTDYLVSLPGGNYFVRVNAFNVCLDLVKSETVRFSVFDPLAFEGVQLWLAADSVLIDEQGRISQVFDKSGNNNHATQTNLSFQPVLVFNDPLLNNQPGLAFNGTTQFLNGTTIERINESSLSLFVVSTGNPVVAAAQYLTLFSIDNNFWLARYIPDNRQAISSYNNNPLTGIIGNFPNSGLTAIHSFLKNFNNSGSLYQNRFLEGSSTNLAGSFINSNYKIGLSNSFPTTKHWNGKIFEILLFNRFLSEEEKASVETYLGHKYSPPVNLGADRRTDYGFSPVVLDAGDRFEHYEWNTGDTTSSIVVNRSGTYGVSVTDVFGFESSDEVVVRYPAFSLNVEEAVVCLGDTLVLGVVSGEDAGSAGPGDWADLSGYSLLWSTGDTTASIGVAEEGVYTLMITDSLGFSREWSATVCIDRFSEQASLGEDRPFCMGAELALELSDPEAGPKYKGGFTWHWSTGETAPVIVIHEPGTYWVEAVNENGCVARDTVTLSFQGYKPLPFFEAEAVCPGEATLFLDGSSVAEGAVVGWRWDFGDGHGSTEQNPVHILDREPGTEDVDLWVITDAGCADSVQLPVRVYFNPEVWFTPNHACHGVPTAFNDQSSDPDGFGLAAWQWDFGPWGSSGEQHPGVSFGEPGSVTVSLEVHSRQGCRAAISREVTIRQSPDPAFQWTPACEGQAVAFAELGEQPPWLTITGRHWDFGDGTTGSQQNPTHLYSDAGLYTVTLSLSALNGCSRSHTQEVTVHSLPVVDFTADDACQQSPHPFLDLSAVEHSEPVRWQWDFGGLGHSSAQHPVFIFPEAGIVPVTLEVTSAAGCSGSATRGIRVNPRPEAAFSFYPRYGTAPLEVAFTNTSSGAATFLWDFGDGSPTVTQPNPTHTYMTNGIRQATLVAYSAFGCPDTASHEIKVIPMSVDLAVSRVEYSLADGFMEVRATLLNLGTLEPDTLWLDLHLDGRDPLREQWTGLLRSGGTAIHTFGARLPVDDPERHAFLCVTVSVPGLADDDPSDNRYCLSFSNAFQVLEPRPNPALDEVTIPFILPHAGAVQISLHDSRGNRLIHKQTGHAPEGLSFVTLPLHELNAGIYYIRVHFHENVGIKKIVIM